MPAPSRLPRVRGGWEDVMTITFGSLFAGIGGIDLGLERAGMECKWQVEIDPFCRLVLAKHWPNVARYEDVREVGKHNLEPVDLIAGGIPCQPHSLNGERRGAADDRNLWPEYFRVVRELKPAWVILENVPGIVTTMLDDIVSDLEGENHQARTVIVPACAFGAPHIRERVFVVAYSEGVGWERGGDTRKGRHGPANRSESLADSASKRKGRLSIQPGRSQQEGADTYGGCEIFHPESQGLQNRYPRSSTKQEREGAFCGLERPNWWAVEPNVGRVAHGVPNRVDRLRSLGNAVVPQVAEWIGRRIVEADGGAP